MFNQIGFTGGVNKNLNGFQLTIENCIIVVRRLPQFFFLSGVLHSLGTFVQ
jgi:hypothetical protein